MKGALLTLAINAVVFTMLAIGGLHNAREKARSDVPEIDVHAIAKCANVLTNVAASQWCALFILIIVWVLS